MTGQPGPLSAREFRLWQAYRDVVVDTKRRLAEADPPQELIPW